MESTPLKRGKKLQRYNGGNDVTPDFEIELKRKRRSSILRAVLKNGGFDEATLKRLKIKEINE